MKTRSHLSIMSKHILSNFLFCFQTKSSFGHGAHKRSCKSIFPGFKRSGSEDDHLPSYLFESTFPFPNSFWWRVSRWFSGANHLTRPVITECQQCKMTQSLIHNGKNTLVLNPLKDFVIHPDKTPQNSPLRLFNADHWVSL